VISQFSFDDFQGAAHPVILLSGGGSGRKQRDGSGETGSQPRRTLSLFFRMQLRGGIIGTRLVRHSDCGLLTSESLEIALRFKIDALLCRFDLTTSPLFGPSSRAE